MPEWLKYMLTLLCALPLALGLIVLFGMMIEDIGQRDEEHDRCLKNAINGYEIRQCR